MTGKDNTIYLRHILEAIELIESYISDISYKHFKDTRLIQDGVVRQLEIIGEATKNLSKSLRDSTTEIPWKDMAGMRDKLIHQYFGVDIEAVWATAQEDLPEVKRTIESMLIPNK